MVAVVHQLEGVAAVRGAGEAVDAGGWIVPGPPPQHQGVAVGQRDELGLGSGGRQGLVDDAEAPARTEVDEDLVHRAEGDGAAGAVGHLEHVAGIGRVADHAAQRQGGGLPLDHGRDPVQLPAPGGHGLQVERVLGAVGVGDVQLEQVHVGQGVLVGGEHQVDRQIERVRCGITPRRCRPEEGNRQGRHRPEDHPLDHSQVHAAGHCNAHVSVVDTSACGGCQERRRHRLDAREALPP